MIQESEIRAQIALVQTGALSIDGLRSWLNARALNMHLGSAPAAQRLAGLVSLLLSEHLLDDRTDAEVMDVLGRLVATVERSADMVPAGHGRIYLQSVPSSTSRVSRRELRPVLV